MALFRYRALEPSGALLEGEVEALDPKAAIQRLQNDGNFPISVEAAGGEASVAAAGGLGPGLRRGELTLFVREFATLLGAGVAMDRALALVAGLTGSSRIARVAETLRAGVLAGEPLSALCARVRGFPRVYAAMIAAGEAKGDVAGALERVAVLVERARAVSQTLVSSLLYPASVTAVSLVSAVFLLTFVVPRFEAMLREMHHELPAPTRAMLAVSGFLQATWPFLLVLLLGAAALFAVLLRKPGFRLAVDRRLLRLPFAGTLLQKIEAERYARLLGSLLAADVALPRAMAMAREAAANRAIAAALEDAETAVERGDFLPAALAHSGLLPELLVELARVGIETGRLPEMLTRVGDVLKREIEVTTTRFVSIVTPASTILLGLFVAALVLGIFSAVLEVYDLEP
jgi:general secretion pathway protein F